MDEKTRGYGNGYYGGGGFNNFIPCFFGGRSENYENVDDPGRSYNLSFFFWKWGSEDLEGS